MCTVVSGICVRSMKPRVYLFITRLPFSWVYTFGGSTLEGFVESSRKDGYTMNVDYTTELVGYLRLR